jgi:hypothetical protein
MISEIRGRQGQTLIPPAAHTVAVIRRLAYLSLVGNGCFAAAVSALHLLQRELSPLNEAVSYYVHGRHGWLLTAGLLAWAVGSAALLAGLALAVRGRISAAGLWGLGLWSLGLVIGAIFPADPPGHWDQPTAAGLIHGNAALMAFVVFPPAAFLLARSLRRETGWYRIGEVMKVLAITAAVSLLAFFASLVPVIISPGPPKLLGLTERILLTVYATWLSVAAIGLRRASIGRSVAD